MSYREQARKIIDHFKQDDPLGIPGLPIPDPVEIPDVAAAGFAFTQCKLSGFSLFTIKNFTVQQSDDSIQVITKASRRF